MLLNHVVIVWYTLTLTFSYLTMYNLHFTHLPNASLNRNTHTRTHTSLQLSVQRAFNQLLTQRGFIARNWEALNLEETQRLNALVLSSGGSGGGGGASSVDSSGGASDKMHQLSSLSAAELANSVPVLQPVLPYPLNCYPQSVDGEKDFAAM